MKSVAHLSPSLVCLAAYSILTVLISGWGRRRHESSHDYLNATHALALPVVVAAYIASNCGALEIMGLSAMASHYGILALHFYLLGAIPALLFLALCFMHVYRRSGASSVPDYLLRRYGPRMRLLNACVTACVLLVLAGISLYAMSQVLIHTTGMSFEEGLLLTAGVVGIYVLIGGIRGTIYNEVVRLAVIVVGLVPLSVRSISVAGVHLRGFSPPDGIHLWGGMHFFAPQARMDGFGLLVGMGFVLGFGYWCTDFVMMQRAFTARTEEDARQVPLWAALGKLGFAFLVVIPGVAAPVFLGSAVQPYDRVMPRLMTLLYSPWMLGLGLTALFSSLMSSLASNVSGFAALWTEDIYRASLVRHRSDRHYLRVARVAIVVALLISLFTSYLNFLFKDLMEHIQLVFSVFGSPFWAVFLLGIVRPRVTERGAIRGFLAGSLAAIVHSVAVVAKLMPYGSQMTANFYGAALGFAVAALTGWLGSGGGREVAVEGRWDWHGAPAPSGTVWALMVMVLSLAIAMTVYFR